MKNLFLILLISILASSCEVTKNYYSVDTDANSPLIHTVYLELKDDLSENEISQFVTEIKKVSQISQVKGLKVGEFADLKDKRAMSNLDLVFQMGFNSEADYQAYQAHEIHLALKEVAKKYLSGPPITHDFYQID